MRYQICHHTTGRATEHRASHPHLWPFSSRRVHGTTYTETGYTDMFVYDGLSDQQIEFESFDGIATMTENANLQTALLKALATTKLDLRHDKVKRVTQAGDNTLAPLPQVELASGDTLSAALLVGADGANSPVRQFAGIESRGWDYPHFGVVSALTHGREDYKAAHQRMLPSGPIAFLPMSGNLASMVWSIHPRYATKIKSCSSAVQVKLINAAFRLNWVDLRYILERDVNETEDELDWRLSQPSYSSHAPPVVTAADDTAAFPLRFRHAETYHSLHHRVALIGDAAHTIHPMAGQGLNCGLADAASLARAITDCCQTGGDLGSVGQALSRDRYWANARVHGVVDKLHKLYAREEQLIVSARSRGSNLIDMLGPLKRAVMSAAG